MARSLCSFELVAFGFIRQCSPPAAALSFVRFEVGSGTTVMSA